MHAQCFVSPSSYQGCDWFLCPVVVTPLVVTASSAFIYFLALWSSSTTIFGGLLAIEKKKSPGSNTAWKFVRMT